MGGSTSATDVVNKGMAWTEFAPIAKLNTKKRRRLCDWMYLFMVISIGNELSTTNYADKRIEYNELRG